MARNNSSDQSGFTLLEVIIALAIMVVAFSAILSVESGSINASARAKQMNFVAMLAHNKMIETEYKIEGKTFDEVKKEESGTYEPPFETFRWSSEIKEIDFPNLNLQSMASPDDQQSGGSGSSDSQQAQQGADLMDRVTKLITKFLSKSVRQVEVKIIWQKAGKDQSFSLTTYWVDLNHDFDLEE